MSDATVGYGSILAHSTDGTTYTAIAQTVDLPGPEPEVGEINITNNDLEVNLGGFVLAPLAKITLFDGDQSLATNRIFGTFANYSVDGVLNPAN